MEWRGERPHPHFLEDIEVVIAGSPVGSERDVDPFRPHLRDVRQARSEDAEPDLEARRCEAETDRLHERLGASEIRTKLRSFSVSSTRTFDSMVYEITIDPWTSDMASRIRELAAPTPVTVNPPP